MERLELARAIYQIAHLRGRFTLRSGAVAEEYFDKYLFEADPHLLRALGEHLRPLVPQPLDALAGLEMGGIPLAVQLGQLMDLPTRFVRREAKTYGTCRLAEGGAIEGQHLVVVEDVVTSGGQILASTQALRELGATVTHVVAVIDRESGGVENLAAEGLELRALFRMGELQDAGAA